ncbi:major facilitator superfamily domain-containing protein [Nemania diffusa]|nr:major facilitator superfamily domain-containing protein [Nemania diffusa]
MCWGIGGLVAARGMDRRPYQLSTGALSQRTCRSLGCNHHAGSRAQYRRIGCCSHSPRRERGVRMDHRSGYGARYRGPSESRQSYRIGKSPPWFYTNTSRAETNRFQIFSFISIGELMAPVIGGALYEKTGYIGVFTLGASILALDFLMRLLVVEKKAAAKYTELAQDDQRSPQDSGPRVDQDADGAGRESSEEDALLPKEDEAYKIRETPNKLMRSLPILICFRSPRLLVGLFLAFVQAALLAVYDATIPTEAQSLFHFSSLKAGLIFIALDVPYLLLGPLAGWAVDRYGTKPVAVIGFGWMVPALTLLRLPAEEPLPASRNIVLYCALLALNGVGLAIIGSPSVVEASDVVQRYDKANPGLFGENGPYAQLYGFNSLFFCAGLTIGPVVAGALKDSIGYGNMNLVFAVLSAATAVLSFLVIGGTRGILRLR